ncbi:substrate-binding periplasmic protein [Salidesulfovibrio onnuriiensis]|uniref:substrate-binding periplasmic protein n=1 Tax=Salidesulfovibrio onnuriiensis TaxID=2583823 RepID=UPI0011C93C48|nr:transporter substrate-binding domain-containing protein [Salidesulfovibrio onnuriiensis]
MPRLLAIITLLATLAFPSIGSATNFEILTGEWAPYVSESMEGGGPTAIIVTEALKAAGHSATFKYVPWARTEALTQSGQAVGTFPWSATEKFSQTCLQSTPLASQKMVFFYLKDKMPGWDYTTLDALKSLKVGGSRGYTYVEMFEGAGIKPDYAADVSKSFKKLLAGRVDVVPESQLVGWQTIKSGFAADEGKFANADTPLFVKALYLQISKKHPDGQALFDAFEKGFQMIKDNGTYKGILDKYGLSE